MWQVDEFDPGAYLARIGHPAVTTADAATLRSLHVAHLAAIAFENVDPLLGRVPGLDQKSLQHKLIHSGRGGYCYEQNRLFAAALEHFGYRLVRSDARVRPDRDPPGPRAHMMVLAEADGERWLVDVGYGDGLLEPLPLREGTHLAQGWTYRLREQDGWWRVTSINAGEETPMYLFTGEPVGPSDYDVYNYYTATHPDSPFTGQVVAMRLTGTEHTVLHRNTLRVRYPDGGERETELGPGEHAAALAEHFGLRISEDDAAALNNAASA